jgi:tRNA(Ile)-lysidine synthase
MEQRDKIIAAVSGGVDSVVLLDLLAKEREALGLSVIVAHFNFQLRGPESDADEQFVVQRARHYGLEVYVDRADCAEYARLRKMGIQEAARQLRYEFFDNLLFSSGFDKIATAHNANDNAETILLNMFRGAGVAGLSGIPIYREDRRIIRPLLFAERQEIEAYAAAERLPFRTDSSNAQDDYTRNYLRLNILPLIQQEINPNIIATLNRSAELFRELETYLTTTAREHYEAVVTHDSTTELHIAVSRLRALPRLMQQYVVILVAQSFANSRPDFEQVQRILELTDGLSGSWVAIDKDHVVFRDRDHLVFRKTEEVPEFRFAVVPNHSYRFGRFSFSSELVEAKNLMLNGKEAEYIDGDRVAGKGLVLRSWTDGDWFIPLGMKSRKKISDFFVDAKIPIYEKPHIPILETTDGEVVWVCGHRIDDRFKVTPETRRVLKLQFSTTEQANDA